MSHIESIKAELFNDPPKGINNITKGYSSTNTVQQNLALINAVDIEVYKQSINTDDLYKEVFTGSVLLGTGAAARDDFNAFIGPLLSRQTISNPEQTLKQLIDSIFNGAGDEALLRANFGNLIKKLTSAAQIIGVGEVNEGDMGLAMNELGWI